jgi:hypothetical protein
MAEKIRVLIFPAGEINSVELHDALSTCVNVELFGASSVDRHGPYIFKNYIKNVPFITDKSFIKEFNRILVSNKIDVIFLTHDTVVEFFAERQNLIKAKIVGADTKTASVCRDKKKIYELFSGQFFTPKIYTDIKKVKTFPLFLKPRVSQGSVGARKIIDRGDLGGVDLNEHVLTEYLPGEEYTVDCLTDKNGDLKVVSPRSRIRTLAGVSVAGESIAVTKEVQSIAEGINQKLTFLGLWFFQIKKDATGKFKLLEVSTRCAGGMCLTRALGANLPLLSVYTVLGYDIDIILNNCTVTVDRTLIGRYRIDYKYDNVYFDFDDTLIINGKVHLYSIMFLYQCKNLGKKVYLLTKHPDDINKTLQNYAIDKNLFTDIIHLSIDEQKAENIKKANSIFIDNAFSERKFIHDKLGIPVFDVDMLEVLLDWRI